jgi:hypothetical protein
MLLGEPQYTIKSHLVFTALFCFAPFSVFSSRMSAPYFPSDCVSDFLSDSMLPRTSRLLQSFPNLKTRTKKLSMVHDFG